MSINKNLIYLVVLLLLTKHQFLGLVLLFIYSITALYLYPRINKNYFSLFCLVALFSVLTVIGLYKADQNNFYVLNEFRYVFNLFLIATVAKKFGSGSISFSYLIVVSFIVVGLTRGLNGMIMPIYAGIIFYLASPMTFRQTRGVLGIFSGSGTVTLAILAASNSLKEAFSIRKPFIFFIILISATLMVLYQIYFRGRELDIERIDRIQLYLAFYDILYNSSLVELLFGFGPGTNFLDFNKDNSAPVFLWLNSKFGSHGVYSYLFHSDLIRLTLNYGVFPMIVFYATLARYLDPSVFRLLLVCGIFNPILGVPSVTLALLFFGCRK